MPVKKIKLITPNQVFSHVGSIVIEETIAAGVKITVKNGDVSIEGSVQQDVEIELYNDVNAVNVEEDIHEEITEDDIYELVVQGDVGKNVKIKARNANVIVNGSIANDAFIRDIKGVIQKPIVLKPAVPKLQPSDSQLNFYSRIEKEAAIAEEEMNYTSSATAAGGLVIGVSVGFFVGSFIPGVGSLLGALIGGLICSLLGGAIGCAIAGCRLEKQFATKASASAQLTFKNGHADINKKLKAAAGFKSRKSNNGWVTDEEGLSFDERSVGSADSSVEMDNLSEAEESAESDDEEAPLLRRRKSMGPS